MQSGKGEKKVPAMTKPTIKKQNLSINLRAKTLPTGLIHFSAEQIIPKHNKSMSTLTSPTHLKTILPFPQATEQHGGQIKKNYENGVGLLKRTNVKEIQSQRVDIRPRLSTTVLEPSKATFAKEKTLITQGSEKNFNLIQEIEKKQTRQMMATKIHELERMLEEQKTRTSILKTEKCCLTHLIEQVKTQNMNIKNENTELKIKIEKYKYSNEETKKMLKERVHSFNQEGKEVQALRNQIKTLQQRIKNILNQNQTLKYELSKFSDSNFNNMKKIAGSNMIVSTVNEVVAIQSLKLRDNDLKNIQESNLKKESNRMQILQQNIDPQCYISEQDECYLEQCKVNIDLFQSIKNKYEQILASIEHRYKTLTQSYEQRISQQAAELYEIQLKNDQLQEQNHCSWDLSCKLSLEMDETILKTQLQISRLTLAVFDLKSENKKLIEDKEHHQAHCKFLQALLQIQRMKKEFKYQNDKNQFNVEMQNLLKIIGKLKLQISRQKEKDNHLKEQISSQV